MKKDTLGRTLGIVALSVLIVVNAVGLLFHAVHDSRLDANANERLRAICQNAATLEDVLDGGIAIVTAERNDPGVPDATHVADDVFIARFNADKILLARSIRALGCAA